MVAFTPNYDAILASEGVLLALGLAAKACICLGEKEYCKSKMYSVKKQFKRYYKICKDQVIGAMGAI